MPINGEVPKLNFDSDSTMGDLMTKERFEEYLVHRQAKRGESPFTPPLSEDWIEKARRHEVEGIIPEGVLP